MNKAIILDIDGVIIGSKEGINTPLPTVKVIDKLRVIQDNGIPVCLCTGRASVGIVDIVKEIELDCYHITDCGAITLNPLTNKVFEKHLLESEEIEKIIKLANAHDIDIMLNIPLKYYMANEKKSSLLDVTATAMYNKKPTFTNDLSQTAKEEDIIGAVLCVPDMESRKNLEKLLEDLDLNSEIVWTKSMLEPDAEFAVITAKDISKASAVKKVIEDIGLSLENALGVGDTMGDWVFMEYCGYVGTLGNADDELKKLVNERDTRGIIGKSVDENGIIDILDWYMSK